MTSHKTVFINGHNCDSVYQTAAAGLTLRGRHWVSHLNAAKPGSAKLVGDWFIQSFCIARVFWDSSVLFSSSLFRVWLTTRNLWSRGLPPLSVREFSPQWKVAPPPLTICRFWPRLPTATVTSSFTIVSAWAIALGHMLSGSWQYEWKAEEKLFLTEALCQKACGGGGGGGGLVKTNSSILIQSGRILVLIVPLARAAAYGEPFITKRETRPDIIWLSCHSWQLSE